MARRIFIIAGESSGDMHAAKLIEALKLKEPDIEVVGFGGPRMKGAGCTLLYDMMPLAVVGFVEVFKNIRVFSSLLKKAKNYILEQQPDAVVFLDYPGFNLRVAQRVREGFKGKLIYYITPQVWAWHRGRLVLMRKILDRLLVIFPFEKTFFDNEGMGLKTTFVGHPLLDQEGYGNSSAEKRISGRIGVMPGSRDQEIQKMLPAALSCCEHLGSGYEYVFVAANQRCREKIEAQLAAHPSLKTSVADHSLDVMKTAQCMLIKSGTSTLEAALMGVPFVMFYIMNPVSAFLVRRLSHLKSFGIVNIVLGRKATPEIIQEQATGARLAQAIRIFLNESDALKTLQKDYSELRHILGNKGASQRAAEAVIREIS